MKSAFKIVFAGTLGVIAGASAMSVLKAQPAAAPAPAYLVVNIESVNDDAMYQKYRAEAPKTEDVYGGHAIVRGAMPIVLDSSPKPKGSIVVIQFPSLKNLQAWWNSPAYTAVRPLREKSTKGTSYVVEGVPPS